MTIGKLPIGVIATGRNGILVKRQVGELQWQTMKRTVRIRHLNKKTAVLSCHRCIKTLVLKKLTIENILDFLLPVANVIKLFTAVSYDIS
jgi:hypothetical protein